MEWTVKVTKAMSRPYGAAGNSRTIEPGEYQMRWQGSSLENYRLTAKEKGFFELTPREIMQYIANGSLAIIKGAWPP